MRGGDLPGRPGVAAVLSQATHFAQVSVGAVNGCSNHPVLSTVAAPVSR